MEWSVLVWSEASLVWSGERFCEDDRGGMGLRRCEVGRVGKILHLHCNLLHTSTCGRLLYKNSCTPVNICLLCSFNRFKLACKNKCLNYVCQFLFNQRVLEDNFCKKAHHYSLSLESKCHENK